MVFNPLGWLSSSCKVSKVTLLLTAHLMSNFLFLSNSRGFSMYFWTTKPCVCVSTKARIASTSSEMKMSFPVLKQIKEENILFFPFPPLKNSQFLQLSLVVHSILWKTHRNERKNVLLLVTNQQLPGSPVALSPPHKLVSFIPVKMCQQLALLQSTGNHLLLASH